jgi:N-succinyldiaminopimelate aminotransferase
VVYEGEHIPLVTLPGMAGRTLTISSAGKTFSFTGWKVGWVTGSPELVSAVRTTKQFITFVSSGPFQYAVAAGLALPDSFYTGLADSMRHKRDLLSAGLADAGFEVFASHGTYFVTTDIAALGGDDGLAFCRDLPRRCGVVAVPNMVFYDDPATGRSQVRFAFCKRDEVLAEAVTRLSRVRGTAQSTEQG